MSDGPLLSEKPAPASPRSAKRRLTFVTLAGVLAIVGAPGGRLLLCDAAGDPADRRRPRQQRRPQGRPEPDAGLQQPAKAALVRLRPVQTDGAAGERQPARRRQGRSRHHQGRPRCAEERAGRGDAAQERRGAVGAAGQSRPRERRPRPPSRKSASSPGAASASSAAPRPTSICSR